MRWKILSQSGDAARMRGTGCGLPIHVDCLVHVVVDVTDVVGHCVERRHGTQIGAVRHHAEDGGQGHSQAEQLSRSAGCLGF